jgi:hypothetical protein
MVAVERGISVTVYILFNCDYGVHEKYRVFDSAEKRNIAMAELGDAPHSRGWETADIEVE